MNFATTSTVKMRIKISGRQQGASIPRCEAEFRLPEYFPRVHHIVPSKTLYLQTVLLTVYWRTPQNGATTAKISCVNGASRTRECYNLLYTRLAYRHDSAEGYIWLSLPAVDQIMIMALNSDCPSILRKNPNYYLVHRCVMRVVSFSFGRVD